MFDGPDGVGKTSQIELARQALDKKMHKVVATRIVGGTPIGEELRKVFLSSLDRPPQSDLHIVLAMNYALAQHLHKLTQEGVIILIDRSPFSILAYEAFAGSLSEEEGYDFTDRALEIFQPELIIAYTAPIEVLQKRLAETQDRGKDFFESKPLSYFKKVMAGYDAAIAKYNPTVIDAAPPLLEVHKATMDVLHQFT